MEKLTDKELDARENNIVDALLEAATLRAPEQNRRTVVIKRGERTLFSFTVEGLTEDDWRKCRSQNLKNRGKRNEELDTARFLSQAIFEATVEEDKNRLWRNKSAQKKLDAATPVDVVNAVLTPGEKSRIAEVLESISGYAEDELDIVIKN